MIFAKGSQPSMPIPLPVFVEGAGDDFIVAGAGSVDLEKTWIPAGVEHTLELSAVDVHAAFFKAHSKSS
jgi:hypothetical protein